MLDIYLKIGFLVNILLIPKWVGLYYTILLDVKLMEYRYFRSDLLEFFNPWKNVMTINFDEKLMSKSPSYIICKVTVSNIEIL